MADETTVSASSSSNNFFTFRGVDHTSRMAASAAVLRWFAWFGARPSPYPADKIPMLRQSITDNLKAIRERGEDARAHEWLLESFKDEVIAELLADFVRSGSLERGLSDIWNHSNRALLIAIRLRDNAPNHAERQYLTLLADVLNVARAGADYAGVPASIPTELADRISEIVVRLRKLPEEMFNPATLSPAWDELADITDELAGLAHAGGEIR